MPSATPGFTTQSLVALGAALSLLAGHAAAQSAEPDGGGLRLSGFGTVGIAHVDAPSGWGFVRSTDQSTKKGATRADIDSRLGIQLNYAVTPQIELVGQALAARRRSEAPTGDAIEWAFAAYRPTANLTLRAGRLNLDQFVMSDYRNVGFGYLYARPPVEYYGSIPSNLDGVDISQAWAFDDSLWRTKGFAGRSKTIGVRLNDAYGFSLTRESGGLLLRAGWSRSRLDHNSSGLKPLLQGLDQLRALPIPQVAHEAATLHSDLDLAAKPITYATLGMTYERGPWQTAAEATRITLGNSIVRAGYASLGRRLGEVTVFGVISSTGSNASAETPVWAPSLTPIIGPAAAQQAQAIGAAAAYVARQSTRQTTYSLGARWDVHPRAALKLQWDHTHIQANGGFLWTNATPEPGSANIATVVLDFVF